MLGKLLAALFGGGGRSSTQEESEYDYDSREQLSNDGLEKHQSSKPDDYIGVPKDGPTVPRDGKDIDGYYAEYKPKK